MNGIHLYLQTEYNEAYANASLLEQFLANSTSEIGKASITTRAALSIAIKLITEIGSLIEESVHRANCMNNEARLGAMCSILTETYISAKFPPAGLALLKYGRSAILKFPSLQRAFPRLYNILISRIRQTESILGRPLNDKAKQGIIDYHEVGRNEPGRDGSPARSSNYTKDQIQEQAFILEEAGFNRIERAQIMLGRKLTEQVRQAIRDAHELDEDQLIKKVRILRRAGINNQMERRLLIEAEIVGKRSRRARRPLPRGTKLTRDIDQMMKDGGKGKVRISEEAKEEYYNVITQIDPKLEHEYEILKSRFYRFINALANNDQTHMRLFRPRRGFEFKGSKNQHAHINKIKNRQIPLYVICYQINEGIVNIFFFGLHPIDNDYENHKCKKYN